MSTVPRPFLTVSRSTLWDVAVLRKEELCVYSKPLLPLGWRRTTTPSRQFLRSTISCERSTVVEQNSGSKSLISRLRAWKALSATIESTRPPIRNEEAGCRRGVETESRRSSLPVALRRLLPSAAAAAPVLAQMDRSSRRRPPWPRKSSQIRVCNFI